MDEAPNRIRELRMQAAPKLSQEALGNLIGVSKVTISDLERGNMMLTVDYMRRIARALGVLPADLLNQADNPGGLSVDERSFIERLRSATPEQRDQLLRVADVIAPNEAKSPEERKRA
ncbi:helix-turn-helix domain-containing protein [Novosphingobium decolorationis]|uniref:Helix-turn-helix transcriptional regulator n=1 Tax=Novosphingobium decolorationis TaxID=2698673 RepID=A0ABX8E3X9_9SPHN|nr:helix-turn-helix transcriptional regulator [Novosphingobium decolorationis]QVM82955.1 helix-turn-helix transcriptional regulator [Novosphingobium decolorationis]